MDFLTRMSHSLLAMLLCMAAGAVAGVYAPTLGDVAYTAAQVYLAIVSMAAIPLLVVATFFGLRQTMGLPFPGRRIAMIAGLALLLVVSCAATGLALGWVNAPGAHLDAESREHLGELVQKAGDGGDIEMRLHDSSTQATAIEAAALHVARAVDRSEHAGGEAARLFQHGGHQVAGGLLAAGQAGDLVEAGEFLEQELHVAQRRWLAVVGRQSSGSKRHGCAMRSTGLDGHNALHHAVRLAAQAMFVGHYLPVIADLQQFTGREQEIRARRFAESGIALAKGFIDQHAAIAHAIQNVRPQGAPQIVGDDHRIKLLAG